MTSFVYLQVVSEVLVAEGGGLQVVGRLPRLEPGAPLPLGVDQQGVAGRPGHQDAVLDAQLVRGQTLRIWAADLHFGLQGDVPLVVFVLQYSHHITPHLINKV